MADGTEKLAGEILVGDVIRAWDEETSAYTPGTVIAASPANNTRMRIKLSNGLEGLFAQNHRFLRGTEWVELQNLKPGEELSNGINVVSVEPDGNGPVVLITVDRYHTYVTLGVVSHNMKVIQQT
jgi:intein/homing endonuclease